MQVRRVLKDRKARRESQARLGRLDPKALQVPRVRLDHKGRKV